MNKKVSVIVSHGDDEVLGCGGTIARHVAEGDDVRLIIMVNHGMRAKDQIDMAHNAAKILGIKSVDSIGLCDQMMDDYPFTKIVGLLEGIIGTPEIIYTHHLGDLNMDHRITAQAVLTAARPLPGSTVKEIYGMEVLSSTEWAASEPFIPQHFVDIGKYADVKLQALRCYDSEMRDPPHARSYVAVEAREQLRGASVGVCFAEAFTVLRQIR